MEQKSFEIKNLRDSLRIKLRGIKYLKLSAEEKKRIDNEVKMYTDKLKAYLKEKGRYYEKEYPPEVIEIKKLVKSGTLTKIELEEKINSLLKNK